MNKIKDLLKGSSIAMVVAGLLVAGVASAAVLTVYGNLTGAADDVQQSVVFGNGATEDTEDTYDIGNSKPVAGDVYYDLATLVNNSSNKSAKVELADYYKAGNSGWTDVEGGITTSYMEWNTPEEILTGERPTAVYNSNGDKRYEVWYKDNNSDIHYAYYHYNGNNWRWDGTDTTGVSGSYDAPFVMKEDGKYYMVNYGSGGDKQFSIYTSDDGVSWTQKNVVYTETRGDLAKVDNPKILKDESGYKMYFQGKLSVSPNKYYIFLATSNAKSMKEIAAGGMFAAANGGNSVLQPGADGEWDSLRVMQPMVFKSGNKGYTMLYTGYDQYGSKGKIGYAVSEDGISWDKVKVSDESYDKTLGIDSWKTSVVKTNKNLMLFYQNNKGDKTIDRTWLTDVVDGENRMTIHPNEVKPFFVKNDFAINLAPMDYRIKTKVLPVTD